MQRDSSRDSRVIDLSVALRHLAADGLVGFPTETVWGIAARARSSKAIARLRAFKGRSDSQPISILVFGPDALPGLGIEVSPLAARLMERFWPGPLTLVMPRLAGAESRALAAEIGRNDGAIGVRCSPHPVARRLIAAAAESRLGPLTATSFNRTGHEPVRDLAEALRLAEQGERAAVEILDVGDQDALAGAPSTVLDLSGAQPEVIRWGAIAPAELESILLAPQGVGVKR